MSNSIEITRKQHARDRFDGVAVELQADIETVPGSSDVADGWRELIDFGEVWTEADAALWPAAGGDLPVGRSLTYGCETHRDQTGGPRRVRLRLFALDAPRAVMTPGGAFTLRDGMRARAVGRLL